MSIKRDKKLLNFIEIATGILMFVLLMGIVIFSLPNTLENNDETTVAESENGITDSTELLAETEEDSTQAPDTTEAESTEELNETTEAVTSEEETTEDETTDDGKTTIELVAFGDNLLHKGIMDWRLQPDGSYDMTDIYPAIAPLAQAADIAIINEEVPIGGVEIGLVDYPNFNAVFEVADVLHDTGINCMTIATNHVLDMGAPGVRNMLGYMAEHYPDTLMTGAYLTQEDRDKTPIIEVQGVKVAVLDYTYDLNGHSSSEVIVNPLDSNIIIPDVQRAKSEADFVVVCMHWGTEYQMEPNEQQEVFAQAVADAGADLIIGSHPHVVQPAREIVTADGRKTLVYFSLGNLVSLQHFAATMLGGIAKVSITKDETGTYISDFKYDFNMTQWDQNHGGCRVILWDDYTPELAAQHGVFQFDNSFSYDAIKAIVDSMRIS